MQLEELLEELGLDNNEVKIYILLCDAKSLSASAISKQTQIPRTTVYRCLDSLIDHDLVDQILDDYHKLYSAKNFPNLERQLEQKAERIEQIKLTLPSIKDLITASNEYTQPGTKVLFYRGMHRLKQQIWNELEAQDKNIVGFGYLIYKEVFGKAFSERYYQEKIKRGIIGRELISSDDKYITPKHIKRFRDKSRYGNYDWRYINADDVTIRNNLVIYDNVLSILNWVDGEIFGVEIHNKTIADLQKQIFELLWKQACTPEKMLAKLGYK
jgi:sugar-specific transcriptional regulator TrmB